MPLLLAVTAGARAQPVVIGETVEIRSKILNQARTIFVSKPEGYDDGAERYPVLYLLDGETHFPLAAGMVRFLAASDRVPKLLVVGVASGGFAQRTHDLTPPSRAEIDNRFMPGNGGADDFLSFLAGEAIPYVDRTWRTRPYRLLAGHSFGGLFALHTLVAQPRLFNAWLAIDPSLGWNDGAIVAQTEGFLARTKELPADLYLTASGTGRVPVGVDRLTAALRANAPAGLRWSFDWMKEETHLSIPLRSLRQGLEKIFDGWYLTDSLALYDRGGIEAIHRHFREGGRRLGIERSTPPFTVSMVVAGLIREGRLEEAGQVLLHDPKAYPPPWNQLDALARAYAARGEPAPAIRYYTLSLQANPRNEWAKQKLAEMQGKPAASPR